MKEVSVAETASLCCSGHRYRCSLPLEEDKTRAARRRRMEIRRFKLIANASTRVINVKRLKVGNGVDVADRGHEEATECHESVAVGSLPSLVFAVGGDGGEPCPEHGVVSICGRRREMEDAVAVMPSFVAGPVIPCDLPPIFNALRKLKAWLPATHEFVWSFCLHAQNRVAETAVAVTVSCSVHPGSRRGSSSYDVWFEAADLERTGATLPEGVEVTHINLNDGTCAGLAFPAMKVMSLQYHPEASLGPHDSDPAFYDFVQLMRENKQR